MDQPFDPPVSRVLISFPQRGAAHKRAKLKKNDPTGNSPEKRFDLFAQTNTARLLYTLSVYLRLFSSSPVVPVIRSSSCAGRVRMCILGRPKGRQKLLTRFSPIIQLYSAPFPICVCYTTPRR